MKVQILNKKLQNFTGEAWLVKKGKKHYVVSGTDAFYSGWEVLVFECNKDGEVTNWSDVCGGRGVSHDEAINELEELD